MGSLGFNIGLPVAEGEKFNYYEYRNLNFSDMAIAAQKITKIYKSDNSIELRFTDKQKQDFERDKGSFLSALMRNINIASGENDFIFTGYALIENTLYLEW